MLPRSLLGANVAVGSVELRIATPTIDLTLGGPGARLVADRRRAVLHLPTVATFGIQAGHRVLVEPVAGAHDAVVAAWLQGPVAALLLAQRSQFALHANLVEHAGAALALAGPRGVGKTTTSMRLTERGGRLLGDDVLPLTVDEGMVTHCTTGRSLRVEPDVAAALGWDLAGAVRLDRAATKVLLQLPVADPGRLDGIVILEEAPVAAVEHRALTGWAAVRGVRANAYRNRILRRIWQAELFAWAGAVAGAVPIHLVRRPARRATADDVTAAVAAVAAEVAGGKVLGVDAVSISPAPQPRNRECQW